MARPRSPSPAGRCRAASRAGRRPLLGLAGVSQAGPSPAGRCAADPWVADWGPQSVLKNRPGRGLGPSPGPPVRGAGPAHRPVPGRSASGAAAAAPCTTGAAPRCRARPGRKPPDNQRWAPRARTAGANGPERQRADQQCGRRRRGDRVRADRIRAGRGQPSRKQPARASPSPKQPDRPGSGRKQPDQARARPRAPARPAGPPCRARPGAPPPGTRCSPRRPGARIPAPLRPPAWVRLPACARRRACARWLARARSVLAARSPARFHRGARARSPPCSRYQVLRSLVPLDPSRPVLRRAGRVRRSRRASARVTLRPRGRHAAQRRQANDAGARRCAPVRSKGPMTYGFSAPAMSPVPQHPA